MGLRRFDTSDVDAELERRRAHERELRVARSIASRAFAQGFTAALEDDRNNAVAWVPHYEEKSDG